MSEEHEKGMSTKELVAFTGIGDRTWERKRLDGTGPKFCKIGRRIVYLRSDVIAWLRENRFSSTSAVTQRKPNLRVV